MSVSPKDGQGFKAELFSGMPELLKIQSEISTLHQQINQIQGMAGNQKAEMH